MVFRGNPSLHQQHVYKPPSRGNTFASGRIVHFHFSETVPISTFWGYPVGTHNLQSSLLILLGEFAHSTSIYWAPTWVRHHTKCWGIQRWAKRTSVLQSVQASGPKMSIRQWDWFSYKRAELRHPNESSRLKVTRDDPLLPCLCSEVLYIFVCFVPVFSFSHEIAFRASGVFFGITSAVAKPQIVCSRFDF